MVGSESGLDWSRLVNLGETMLDDSRWLLPALLSVQLALVAVLFAQAVTNTDPRLIASTRRIAVLAAVAVGGAATSVHVFSSVAAISSGSVVRLFSVTILVAIIIGIALVIGVIFFGSLNVQLQVAEEVKRETEASLSKFGPAAATSPRSIVLANVGVISAVAVLAYFALSVVLGEAIPNAPGAIVALVALTAISSAMVFVGENLTSEWPSKTRRQAARGVLFLVYFVPVLLLGTTQLALPRAAEVAVLSTGILPLISGWLPGRTRAHRWSLAGAVETATHVRLVKRLRGLETVIAELHKRVTRLVMR